MLARATVDLSINGRAVGDIWNQSYLTKVISYATRNLTTIYFSNNIQSEHGTDVHPSKVMRFFVRSISCLFQQFNGECWKDCGKVALPPQTPPLTVDTCTHWAPPKSKAYKLMALATYSKVLALLRFLAL